MDKILVPTDFSTNSKPGIRFAIRLAARSKSSLVFIHVMGLKDDLEKNKTKLKTFVEQVYQSMGMDALETSFEVIKGFKADVSLLEYCSQHVDVNFICISTRGASFFNKVLGTNTGNLIMHSAVPVIVVPKDYRIKPLRSLLYSTDLMDLENEVQLLIDYARPKGLFLEVMHFSSPSSEHLLKNLEGLESKMNYPLKVKVIRNDYSRSLLKNIIEQSHKLKPSMLCLFTNKDLGFFDKLFSSSLSESISFKSSVPLLVYKKQSND